ncbi:MAG TPA: 4-(cytidine 5'-diphospho)-2-C-methyl-D-erythritol kinase [Bryobacteraceae bacterium]|nr:4-(cytidine 5'-diphospho)-2-C-methyl-D-erythritol kinase [Bryobacteraceae bacterium]
MIRQAGLRQAKLRSLAKINLDLRVLNRRADGFHELRTVFQTISLADTIEIAFEPSRKTSLEIEDALHIPDNLVLRAARLALDAMKITGRVHFRLSKVIPMGAGLGGGSSNAAAVLLALPALAGKSIGFEKLVGLGAELGADVPFFLTGGTAVAVDRGTELYSLADVSEDPILIVDCGLHVDTRAAYQELRRELTLPGLSRNINDFQLFVRTLSESRSARAASAFSANDFEPVVFSQFPQLHALFKRLGSVAARSGDGSAARDTAPRSIAPGATRMTGSGSALFALFRSTVERDLVGESLGRDRRFQGSQVIPAKLVSRRSYQRLWHRQLAGTAVSGTGIWPPSNWHAR